MLLAGQFMVNIDTAIVNVAGPAIREGLRPSGGALELIVSGYTLAYATLLITGARLGEARGHRRMFLLGLAGFTAASLACGLAPVPAALVAARIAQGAAGALMVPQVLSGIQLHFTGRERARAQGLLVLALAGGAVAGQALGGILVAADLWGLGWRPIFLINVPVGLVLLAAGLRLLPADRDGAAGRLDLPGVALLSAAVLLGALPLIFGREAHWPVWCWLCLAASAPALAAFVRRQRRLAARGGAPLLDPEVAAEPVVARTLAALAAATGTYQALLFVLALYLQQGLGRGALYSGLVLVAWVAAFGIAGPLLPRCPDRLAARAPVAAYVILAGAYFGLAATRGQGWALFALLGAGGFGLGLGYAAQLGRLTSAVPARHAPDLSGLVNTGAQLAGVAGVAVLGTLYLSLAGRPEHAFAVVMAAAGATALAAAAAAHSAGRANAGRRGGGGWGQGRRPARRAVLTASRRV